MNSEDSRAASREKCHDGDLIPKHGDVHSSPSDGCPWRGSGCGKANPAGEPAVSVKCGFGLRRVGGSETGSPSLLSRVERSEVWQPSVRKVQLVVAKKKK